MMDPQLPQMETVLDPQAMLGILATDWLAASRRYQLRDCRIGSVRHKPGKSCLIRYDLSLRDLDLGVDVHQVLCGRLHEEGGSDSRWRKAISQPAVEVAIGPAVTHIPRLDLVLWAFPNERKLRGIEVLFDCRRLSEEILPSILGEPVILDGEAELVRYVPEHGCTVRVRLTLPDGKLVLYGKIQAGGDGSKICAFARGLHRRAWYHDATRTLWQAEISGASAQLHTDLDACARALAMFHQQQLPGLGSPSDAPAGKRFEVAARLLTGHHAPLQAIIAEVERRWSSSPATATLHGDLHLKNFLVQAGTAVLIDLDTLSSGNPLEDLGSFAASLYHRAVLDGTPIAQMDELVARFVRTYASLVPWTIADRDVATHTAVALVNERACRSITRRKGNVVDQLFGIAQNLLMETATARDVMNRFAAFASSHSGELIDVHYKTYRKQKSWAKSSVTIAWRDNSGIVVERLGPSPASWRFPHDRAVPWMAEAADPVAVLTHLPVPADQVEIDVLTYRPENRLTARYRIANDGQRQTIYGKTYSDDRGLHVHNRFIQLIERGFPLPTPLGYSPAIKTVWQASFEGEPVRALLNGPHAAQLLQGAARRLRILHLSEIACPARFTLEDMHADLAKKMAKLAAVLPEEADRLRRLVDKVTNSIATLPAVAPRVVHGDFHIRQLMAHGLDVALFDFDELGWGDPAEDFGHFIADLHGDGFDESFVASVAEMLLDGYRQEGGSEIPPERLHWHTAVQLLTRAYRALLQLKPDFDVRVQRHIRLAEELI